MRAPHVPGSGKRSPAAPAAPATLAPAVADLLHRGTVVPAHPLALDPDRKLDEDRQRDLTRYYVAAGAGGVAVGVHTTQFAIREHGLLRPVLELAAEEIAEGIGEGIAEGIAEGIGEGTGEGIAEAAAGAAPGPTATAPDRPPFLKIAGACGPVRQAVQEAVLARELGYDAVLVSPAGLPEADLDALLDRSAAVGEVLPVIGFYLQEAVGGRYLPAHYWRRLADQESTVAVKAAPFDRYRTLELVQGVAASERGADVALYTGNDDAVVTDLLTPYHVHGPSGPVVRHFVGGLLGHWAVWTRSAVRLLDDVHAARAGDRPALDRVLARLAGDTDANAAVYDVRGGFAGCIAGVHEVLRRQGLLAGTWCLEPAEGLSPGQAQEITRVHAAYPWLREEDAFAAGLPKRRTAPRTPPRTSPPTPPPTSREEER